MLMIEEFLDLCSTCSDYPQCSSDARRPVLFCEQYDDFVPAPERNINPKPIPEVKSAPYSEPEEFQFKGLCINCDHRGTCPFARREGGVWHCEEYQ